jgi:hypothetical protein
MPTTDTDRIEALEAEVRDLKDKIRHGPFDIGPGSQQRILKGESEDERLARYSRELAH